jgi:hypothetical protein
MNSSLAGPITQSFNYLIPMKQPSLDMNCLNTRGSNHPAILYKFENYTSLISPIEKMFKPSIIGGGNVTVYTNDISKEGNY